MTGHREGRTNWLDVYPFDKALLEGYHGEPNDVLLVDVAGGQGHDLHDFRHRHKNVAGRLVLEDLSHVFKQMSEKYKEGIDIVEYNFFTPQPIKGRLFACPDT